MPNFRGSKDFDVSMGESAVGPWTTIASGTFPDPRPAGKKGDVVEKTVIRIKEEFIGRYVRYKCTSWYGEACALQYIEVIEGNITTSDVATTEALTTTKAPTTAPSEQGW